MRERKRHSDEQKSGAAGACRCVLLQLCCFHRMLLFLPARGSGAIPSRQRWKRNSEKDATPQCKEHSVALLLRSMAAAEDTWQQWKLRLAEMVSAVRRWRRVVVFIVLSATVTAPRKWRRVPRRRIALHCSLRLGGVSSTDRRFDLLRQACPELPSRELQIDNSKEQRSISQHQQSVNAAT